MSSKFVELVPGLKIVDLALLYKDTLILGDTQLGYEENLERRGILVPRFQLSDILARLENILDQVKVKRVIVNGDIKHEFGTITNQEWRDTLRFFDFIFSKLGENGELILIKGNHDLALDPIARKRSVRVVDQYTLEDITIVHGHKITLTPGKILIIGHEHPAISFRERKGEKFKCFLKGMWHDKTLIVQPSFTLLTEGSDVLQEHYLSPYLKEGVMNFEVYTVDGKARHFGKVKDIATL